MEPQFHGSSSSRRAEKDGFQGSRGDDDHLQGRRAVSNALCSLTGTGLRIEEAIGLQVQDVEGTVIHVRHSH
jgi:hypothetical protein